jgi:hypothetical protein
MPPHRGWTGGQLSARRSAGDGASRQASSYPGVPCPSLETPWQLPLPVAQAIAFSGHPQAYPPPSRAHHPLPGVRLTLLALPGVARMCTRVDEGHALSLTHLIYATIRLPIRAFCDAYLHAVR